jgi:chromosome partitioning protein
LKTIAFLNIKGGVGKTTSSIAFAQILHNDYNKRVLLIDLDKQANSSKAFGCYDEKGKGVADLMTATENIVRDVIVESEYGIDIIPSSFNLMKANQEVLLDVVRPQQFRLKQQLQEVQDEYDYCIIDCPTDVNMGTINGLVMANEVLIPIKVDAYAFDGLNYVVSAINDIKVFNPLLSFGGCFLTLYAHSNLNNSGKQVLKDSFGLDCFETHIRQTVKVGESTFEKPLMSYAPKCTAAIDYKNLVKEYLEKNNG